MFYSQTFLAKKGPLGTVWCAAHLQHRLKKSHYSSTHISRTVDQIMTPDVPLALRMSAHLLLGVVRIYSKKLEYLHRDYMHLRDSLQHTFRAAHAHAHAHLNANQISTQAAFNDITLPSNFDLDNPRLFPDFDHGSPDSHLRSEDEITLKDQYDADNQIYVRITFEDDINPEGSTMLIDSSPRVSDSAIPADPLPKDTETTMPTDLGRIPDPNQSPERIRDHNENVDYMSPFLRPHVESAPTEPNRPPSVTTKMDIDTPESRHTLTPQMQPRTSPHASGPSSPRLDGNQFESGPFEEPKISELELRPSPSPSPHRPQPRQRRRKRAFDETLVLNNTFYKKALNDTSDLVKKRKKLPSSSLEMWRFINSRKKEDLFLNPLISGMSTSLQYLSSKDLTVLNSRPAESPTRDPQFNNEVEHIRSPDPDPQPNYGNAFSPSQQSIVRDAAPSTSPRMGTDTGYTAVDMDTPMSPSMNIGGTNNGQTNALPEIPEWIMEPDDLLFLEEDNNSPPDSLSGSGRDTMSVRTRAVAQYLTNHSPLSKLTDGSTNDLNLNAILEGRSRKLCARMFYETLVLKNCGLIDVKQDEPYADITLKLTPGISMAKL